MNIVKIKGKWDITDRILTIRKYDSEVKPTIELKPGRPETSSLFETDIMIIQEPYIVLKKIITYNFEYLRDIGEKRHILGMYSELMDKYPDKTYILVSKVYKDIDTKYTFKYNEVEITYEWVIK